MRNFYLTCKFCTLTINFSEVVLPRQIPLYITIFRKERLRNVLKTSRKQEQFKLMIRLENVTKISLQDVLKASWRCLEDVFARRLKDVLKTSWLCLEDGWPIRIYWSWSNRLEEVMKTSSEDVLKTSSEDIRLRRTYLSWSRRLHEDERRRQDVLHQDEYLSG